MARSSTSGQGRPKGSKNRDTAHIKEAVSNFVQGNADRVQALFDELAANNPGKALDVYFGAAEYVLPKLARTENTTELVGQLPSINVTLKKVDGNA